MDDKKRFAEMLYALRKKKLCLITTIIVIIVLSISIGLCTKPGINIMVKACNQSLTNIVTTQWLADETIEHWLGFDVAYYKTGETSVVFFEKQSTSSIGFYYAKDGKPTGYQCNTELYQLQTSGKGWIWNGEQSGFGDNWYYTEPITGNWYWFEMHY